MSRTLALLPACLLASLLLPSLTAQNLVPNASL